MIKKLAHFNCLDIDQYAILDNQGKTIGGITIGIDHADETRAFLMGLHMEHGSPLKVIHELCQTYPNAERWIAYQAKHGRYFEKRIRRPIDKNLKKE